MKRAAIMLCALILAGCGSQQKNACTFKDGDTTYTVEDRNKEGILSRTRSIKNVVVITEKGGMKTTIPLSQAPQKTMDKIVANCK